MNLDIPLVKTYRINTFNIICMGFTAWIAAHAHVHTLVTHFKGTDDPKPIFSLSILVLPIKREQCGYNFISFAFFSLKSLPLVCYRVSCTETYCIPYIVRKVRKVQSLKFFVVFFLSLL